MDISILFCTMLKLIIKKIENKLFYLVTSVLIMEQIKTNPLATKLVNSMVSCKQIQWSIVSAFIDALLTFDTNDQIPDLELVLIKVVRERSRGELENFLETYGNPLPNGVTMIQNFDRADSTYGLRPVTVMCKKGYTDLVKMFIEQCNVDPFVKDAHGFTCVQYAEESGNNELISYIKTLSDQLNMETNNIKQYNSTLQSDVERKKAELEELKRQVMCQQMEEGQTKRSRTTVPEPVYAQNTPFGQPPNTPFGQSNQGSLFGGQQSGSTQYSF